MRAEVTLQYEAFAADSLSLYDAQGQMVPQHYFDETSLVEDLDHEGLERMDGVEPEYFPESTSYVIDLAAVRAADKEQQS